jgi:carboxybiotin decarboxylase
MTFGLILVGGLGAISSLTQANTADKPGVAQAQVSVKTEASALDAPAAATKVERREISISKGIASIAERTGVSGFLTKNGWKTLVMILVGFVLLYLGVVKDFEPMLLVPIGFGTILVNVPFAGMGDPPHGLLYLIFKNGIENELLPLIVFIGIGALSDFGPLLANPRMAILGAAAQFGVFGTLLGVMVLNLIPGFDYSLMEACAIAIIGGADGPTSIYVSSLFAPHLMGSIAVAAYSYMALVPLIQPPIMRALTTEAERKIKMHQVRPVHKMEKVLFPLFVTALCFFILPSAMPLMGSFAFGNFVKECGCLDRLAKAMQNELMNLATIFLGLGVGMQMSADKFLNLETLGILLLGMLAFSLGTAGGVLFAKFMNIIWPKNPINPLIGSAGVSAFPMAARVSNKLGLEADPHNFLLMHALGANVAGQIGSVVAAGVILAIFGY